MTGTTDRDYLKTNEQLLAQNKTVTNRSHLVALCCSMDDIPVRSFRDYDDAVTFIHDNPPYPNCPANGNNCPEVENAYRIVQRDVGCVLGYDLYTFADGKLIAQDQFHWHDNPVGWQPAPGWEVDDIGEIRPIAETAAGGEGWDG